jgi:Brp/Blh family beta-carotene 15,15'-monooxygenase
MTKLKRYLLVLGLLLTFANSLFVIPIQAQLYFLYTTIFVSGIPHGALDYFVASQTQIQVGNKLTLSKFLSRYLINIVIYSIIWIISPYVGFAIFMLLTAFHFGEVDWPIRQNTKLDALLYTLFGFLILTFIISSHADTALPVVVQILKLSINNTYVLKQASIVFAITVVLLLLCMVLIAIFFKSIGWSKQITIDFILQTIVLLLIIYFSPLYLAFGFYFGIWHSVLSFNLIRKHLSLPNTKLGWLQMAQQALPYAVAAWAGIAILVIASNWYQKAIITSNLGIVFIAISILTLPHLQVFTKLKK